MARHSFLCRAVLLLATKSFRCGCWTKGRDFGRVGEKKRGNTDMDLAQRIRALRQQRELSQEALAERMEVSRQAVTKWEKGTARPSTEKLLRLSQVLEVPLETLVGTEPAARRGRRNVLPIVLLGAALLLGAAAGAVLFWFYRSAPPEGIIGYADGPTQIYVSGSPILVWLLGVLALLAGAGALVSFLLGRKGRQS